MYSRFFFFFFFFLYPSFIWVDESKDFKQHSSLAFKAKDPLTKLRQLQLESDFTPKNLSSSDCGNILYIKPIIPLKENLIIPIEQLIRIEFQIVSLAKSKAIAPCTVLGDTQIFDLFIFEEQWGRWGVGPVIFLPTAENLNAGQGKWQIGPAFAFSILDIPNLQFGLLVQNPIAVAGSSNAPFVNTLYVQPSATYHLKDQCYIGTNPQWILQWNDRNIQIPLNLGIGKVFSIGKQPIDTSLYAEWLVYQNAKGVIPQFTLQFSFNLLFGSRP